MTHTRPTAVAPAVPLSSPAAFEATVSFPLAPADSPRRLLLPPALSRVQAGFPSPAEEYVKVRLDLNELLIRRPGRRLCQGRSHVSGIKSFRGYAKRRLVKSTGVPGHPFYLHLKEREFRFNRRGAEHCGAILAMLRRQQCNLLPTPSAS